MSVLLTTGKKAWKTKSAKPKSRRKANAETLVEPPPSSVSTKVWYWMLQGQPVTVMIASNSNAVWCNHGKYLACEVRRFRNDDMFLEKGDGVPFEVAPTGTAERNLGTVIDFPIFVENKQICHHGRIKKMIHPMTGATIILLYVDGANILEHTSETGKNFNLGAEFFDVNDRQLEADVGNVPPPAYSAHLSPPEYTEFDFNQK